MQNQRYSSHHATNARIAKRDAASTLGVDDAFVSVMVENFYAKIQKDAVLGPIFSNFVHNWPEHMMRMKAFWRSVLFNSGEFSGNPMMKHIAIPGLDESHFAHWLELFYDNLRDMEQHDGAATLVGGRARMIAESLLSGIMVHRHGIVSRAEPVSLPHV